MHVEWEKSRTYLVVGLRATAKTREVKRIKVGQKYRQKGAGIPRRRLHEYLAKSPRLYNEQDKKGAYLVVTKASNEHMRSETRQSRLEIQSKGNECMTRKTRRTIYLVSIKRTTSARKVKLIKVG